MPKRAFAVTAAAVAAAVTAASCSGSTPNIDTGPLAGLPWKDGVQIVNESAAEHPSWHYGSLAGCVRDGVPVTLDSVEVNELGDIRLSKVGVREIDGSDMAGAMPGDLPAKYSSLAGYVVSDQCGTDPGVELVLQFDTPAAAAGINGFIVNYHRGDERYRTLFAARIILCAGDRAPLHSDDGEVFDYCTAE